jgi:AP-3 complex subunit beta
MVSYFQDLGEEEEAKKPFYDEDEDEEEDGEVEEVKKAPSLDPDHRLLLRSAKPLLQSRNASVIIL